MIVLTKEDYLSVAKVLMVFIMRLIGPDDAAKLLSAYGVGNQKKS